MKIALIQFNPWDKVYDFSLNNLALIKGDYVIVKTELGTELGQVVGFGERQKDGVDKPECKGCQKGGCQNHKEAPSTSSLQEGEQAGQVKKEKEIKPIVRKATPMDIKKQPSEKDKKDAKEYCKKMIDKHELPMKLVDVRFSFDGSRLTFAFIADGRVDFRELVKDLTRHFNRTIRLHQIGIRDEAKFMGDYGHCGRGLCCRGHLKDLLSITSEMAERQQVVHRGSERISGICGRLMCCLAYEEGGYSELAKNMPPLGTKVNVGGKRGVIVGHHILKQSVDVSFQAENGGADTIAEVDLKKK